MASELERWRKVLEGTYEVSNMGRVRRAAPGRKTYPGRLLKQHIGKIGYPVVNPVIDGRNVIHYVHWLVAEAFMGPRVAGHEVNHKDGNKANPRLSNLEYVSHAENMAHAARSGLMVRGESHPFAKLTDADVRRMRRDSARGASFSQIAEKYGVSIATAFNAVRGNSWKHVA